MKTSTNLALAAAIGAGLFVGTAEAQEFRRDYDTISNCRASEGEAVHMRLTIPFQAEADRRDTRLSFAFRQGDGEGRMRNLDMFSFSLAGEAPRLEAPVALNAANGEGGFFSKPVNWLWIGLGAGVAYWIYDENQDDDSGPPPPS
ncbi:MAG: hypothetical protein R3C27_06685 [Hyphomonadaceae bacterium]